MLTAEKGGKKEKKKKKTTEYQFHPCILGKGK